MIDIELIKYRALAKKKLRELLESAPYNLIEVDVPSIGREVCPDPSSWPIKLEYQKKDYYLQPSPEYFLKRLLSMCPGNYYSLAPCFRDDPVTENHNPEFLMLEYYLLGDSFKLIEQLTSEISKLFIPDTPLVVQSYYDVLSAYTDLNEHSSIEEYKKFLKKHEVDFNPQWSKAELEDLIFALYCQPHLGQNTITIVNDFPYHHRALAQFDSTTNKALRFEAFIDGVEIANGYQELIGAHENLERINQWNEVWLEKGFTPPNSDKFIESTSNLPPCSGVAFGFDRILLLALKKKQLSDVLLFPWSHL